MHVESMVANPPRNQTACLRNVERQKAVKGKALLSRCDQRCSTAIGKDQEGQDLFQFISFLKMQRTELKVQYQNCGFWHRANDVMCRLERVDCRVASHEADHGTFD